MEEDYTCSLCYSNVEEVLQLDCAHQLCLICACKIYTPPLSIKCLLCESKTTIQKEAAKILAKMALKYRKNAERNQNNTTPAKALKKASGGNIVSSASRREAPFSSSKSSVPNNNMNGSASINLSNIKKMVTPSKMGGMSTATTTVSRRKSPSQQKQLFTSARRGSDQQEAQKRLTYPSQQKPIPQQKLQQQQNQIPQYSSVRSTYRSPYAQENLYKYSPNNKENTLDISPSRLSSREEEKKKSISPPWYPPGRNSSRSPSRSSPKLSRQASASRSRSRSPARLHSRSRSPTTRRSNLNSQEQYLLQEEMQRERELRELQQEENLRSLQQRHQNLLQQQQELLLEEQHDLLQQERRAQEEEQDRHAVLVLEPKVEGLRTEIRGIFNEIQRKSLQHNDFNILFRQQVQQTKTNVSNKFGEIRQLLEEKEAEVLAGLDANFAPQFDNFDEKQRQYSEQLRLIRGFEDQINFNYHTEGSTNRRNSQLNSSNLLTQFDADRAQFQDLLERLDQQSNLMQQEQKINLSIAGEQDFEQQIRNIKSQILNLKGPCSRETFPASKTNAFSQLGSIISARPNLIPPSASKLPPSVNANSIGNNFTGVQTARFSSAQKKQRDPSSSSLRGSLSPGSNSNNKINFNKTAENAKKYTLGFRTSQNTYSCSRNTEGNLFQNGINSCRNYNKIDNNYLLHSGTSNNNNTTRANSFASPLRHSKSFSSLGPNNNIDFDKSPFKSWHFEKLQEIKDKQGKNKTAIKNSVNTTTLNNFLLLSPKSKNDNQTLAPSGTFDRYSRMLQSSVIKGGKDTWTIPPPPLTRCTQSPVAENLGLKQCVDSAKKRHNSTVENLQVDQEFNRKREASRKKMNENLSPSPDRHEKKFGYVSTFDIFKKKKTFQNLSSPFSRSSIPKEPPTLKEKLGSVQRVLHSSAANY